jgi:hypothetical protein
MINGDRAPGKRVRIPHLAQRPCSTARARMKGGAEWPGSSWSDGFDVVKVREMRPIDVIRAVRIAIANHEKLMQAWEEIHGY